jgi:hypothetical protein
MLKAVDENRTALRRIFPTTIGQNRPAMRLILSANRRFGARNERLTDSEA